MSDSTPRTMKTCDHPLQVGNNHARGAHCQGFLGKLLHLFTHHCRNGCRLAKGMAKSYPRALRSCVFSGGSSERFSFNQSQ